MKKLALVSLILSLGSPAACADDTQQRVTESRATAKEFMGMLKGELQAAMKAGGPANAIKVCNKRAPEIAAAISTDKGWDIARTSLKVRNADNAPDAWERGVMEEFEKRKAQGEDPKQMEYSAVVEYKGKRSFRYMKAIPTAPVCVSCHGATVAPEVEAQLASLYPQDQARGFNPGDIRGAFTFVQPLQ